MAYDEFSYSEDLGTGLQDDTVDWVDAGAVAWLAHDPTATNMVVDGFEFTVDLTNDILNIASGVAVAEFQSAKTNDHSNEGGPGQRELQRVSFRFQRGPSGDINLNSGVNHVWVASSLTDNNSVDFYTSTDETQAPSDPHVKIGTVDTAAATQSEAVDRANDAPSARFDRILLTPEVFTA